MDYWKKNHILYENALMDSFAVSYKKLSYSDFKLTAVEFFSEKLTNNVYKSEIVFNESRNFATEKISVTVSDDKIIQELSWFDEKNKPAFNKLLGSSKDTVVYNKAGDLIEITSTYENVIMCHKISYDNKNHSQKWETYENDNFYSTQIWFYDSENKLIKCEFYDKNNSLSQTIAKEYSCEKGETIEKTYFDKSERTQIEKYDIYGRHIETAISSYNANISITAKILYNGLNKSIIYYENNVPFSPVNKGFARADFTYDSRGLLQSAAFKNENGESSVHAVLQFSKYIALYTPSGLLKHEEFQDTNGNLVKPSHLKYASFEAETDFDDKFLLHGKYILPNGNTSSKRNVAYFKGHKENNKTFVVYYDISDKPLYHYVYNSDGIREYVGLYSYKENGDFIVSTNSMDKKIISSEYKDKNGKNKNRPNKNYSAFRNTYLENGESITETINENGFVISRQFYDTIGTNTKKISYNKDGSYIELIGNKTFSYDSSGNLISQTEQKIFEDGSYSVYFTEYKYNDSFYSVLNFTKENKLRNNSDGWARKIEFLENGIKRTKYQDADNNLLFYKSEMVVKILDVEQGSIAKNEGVQKDNIVLCLGAFDYFANGSEGDFEKNSSQELKEAVIYNPISKKIVKSHYTDSFGISFNYSYSEENAISEMKTIYDNWIKNNPQN